MNLAFSRNAKMFHILSITIQVFTCNNRRVEVFSLCSAFVFMSNEKFDFFRLMVVG